MPDFLVEQDDVCIFVTEACNSNCIMCPMSLDSRKRGQRLTVEQWQQLSTILPPDITHITVTGGEPFLEHNDLIPALGFLSSSYPNAEILILTNGRILSLQSIFEQLLPLITEQFCFAIPIHAPEAALHDKITQSPGSFSQTLSALRMLKHTPAKIEIRIVGHQLNIDLISDTIKMLVDSDLRITIINIIGMEMMGCAAAHRKELWVDYDLLCKAAFPGIQYAIHHGTDMSLYNFPLCTVPKGLWPLVKNSITPYKVRYYDECRNCKEYNACGGLFYSTYELNLCHIKPFEG